MDLKIQGGNDRLPNALAGDIALRGGRVISNAAVTRVTQGRRGVCAYVEGQATPYEAEACICATPTRSLSAIRWHPALPPAQYSAAQELQYARIAKTVILYDRRFWPGSRRFGFSVFTDRVSDFCFDASFPQSGTFGILCSYAIGDKADDVAGERQRDLARWITADVLKACSATRRRVTPMDVQQYAWQRDELTGSAYALYRPGQLFDILPVLRRPHGRVHFAGEHLADWQGVTSRKGSLRTPRASNLK